MVKARHVLQWILYHLHLHRGLCRCFLLPMGDTDGWPVTHQRDAGGDSLLWLMSWSAGVPQDMAGSRDVWQVLGDEEILKRTVYARARGLITGNS